MEMTARSSSSRSALPRRQVVRVIGLICLAGVVALFGYATFYHREFAAGLHQEIRRYGGLGLLASAFVVDTFGGPLGPEVPVVGGMLAGLSLPVVLSMTAVGSAAASLVVYGVGIFFGEYGALSFTSPERFARWKKVFLRHRRITLTLGALTPVPYVTICLLGGVFRVPVVEFIIFAICARFIRIAGTAYVLLLFKGTL